MTTTITALPDQMDGELLSIFVRNRDESAFEEIVRRYGGMVRSVCRRVLGNSPDADDAYQTVFLILAQKANSVRVGQSLPAWLHSVAVRAAIRAREIAKRRSLREQTSSFNLEPIDHREPEFHDWLPLLDLEMSRLPERLRIPMVLCELQGFTRGNASERLGIPEGTLSSRLSRGREILRRRLSKKGILLTSAMLTSVYFLSERNLAASEPVTMTKACLGANPQPQVATLAQGVLKEMLFEKLKLSLIAVLSIAVVAGSIVGGREAMIYASDVKGDQAKLQGKWKILSIQMGGKEPEGEEAKRILEQVVEIKDDKITLKTAAKFKIDPTKTPHEIEWRVTEGPEREKGEWKGIYEFKDDSLLICVSLPNSDRPTKFETKAGETSVLMKLKKAN